MAAGGHFGWPKITLNRISRHLRSIRKLFFFTNLLLAAILDHRKSLSIAFLTISYQYATFVLFCSQNGCRRPFWMTENSFWSHFSPFQINTQLWFFFHKMPASGHFGLPKITFECISRHCRSIRNIFLFWIFGSPICAKNNRVRPLCVINGYAKYEVDRWIYDTVRDATSFLSIFIQNGRQRPFCLSDWCKKS